ncbi:TetR/AcrR family transcriptional regulator [Paenibacillus sp. BIHB 4019]|nr:TetR/AcrR family transcriptional regulator [Paenibacillus sp. BIHB 4019]
MSNLLDTMIAHSKLSKKQTDKQQKLVETAIKIFAEKGFANTSTSEIAQTAGVSEGAIFRHYGNKENLLLSIVLPFLKEFLPNAIEETFNELLSQNPTTFEIFIRELIKNRVHFIHENKKLFQILVKEILYREEFKKEMQPLYSENILQHLTIVIEMFKERGDLIEIPSSILLRMLLTFLGGYLISRFMVLNEDFIKDEEAELEEVVRFIMDGLRKPQQSH